MQDLKYSKISADFKEVNVFNEFLDIKNEYKKS